MRGYGVFKTFSGIIGWMSSAAEVQLVLFKPGRGMISRAKYLGIPEAEHNLKFVKKTCRFKVFMTGNPEHNENSINNKTVH